MRVCLIAPYPPDVGGVSDYTFNLVSELRKINDLQVFVISRKVPLHESGIFPIISRKRVKRSLLQMVEEVRNLPRTFIEVLKTLRRIKKIRPSVVHVQYEPGLYNLFFCPILFFFLKMTSIKLILTLHARDYFPLNFFHRLLLYSFAHKILVHSPSHKEMMKSGKVSVVPMGISRSGRSNFFQNRNIFFYGLLSPHKGLELLVKSFSEVGRKFPDSRLLIFGNIDPRHLEEVRYSEEIKGLIRQYGLNQKVDFSIKRMSSKDVPAIRSNIAVFPYLKSYSASHSLAVMECIAAGKAVIVSKIPGLFDEIVDGKNGFVVEPENLGQLTERIVELLGNDQKIKEIMNNNFLLSDKFSWKNVALENYKYY